MVGPKEGTSGFEFITSYYVWSIFSAQSTWRWERVVHRDLPGVRKASKKLGRQMGQVMWKENQWDREGTHSVCVDESPLQACALL